MLVLSRKEGQKVVLSTSDGPITIMVTAIRSGNSVQLGIEAPSAVTIYREEILPRLTPEAPLAGRGPLVPRQEMSHAIA